MGKNIINEQKLKYMREFSKKTQIAIIGLLGIIAIASVVNTDYFDGFLSIVALILVTFGFIGVFDS